MLQAWTLHYSSIICWQLDYNHSYQCSLLLPDHQSSAPISSSPLCLTCFITAHLLIPFSVAFSCPSFLSVVQTCPCLASWPYPFKSGLSWAAVSRRLLHTLLGSTDGRDRLPAGTGTPTIPTGNWPTGLALCSKHSAHSHSVELGLQLPALLFFFFCHPLLLYSPVSSSHVYYLSKAP